MYIVAIIAEKGGVGKTTTALDLAVSAMLAGKTAAILDIDPQASASNWTDRRKASTPWVVPTHAARLSVAIAHAEGQRVDLLVIDTAPHSASDSVMAAKQAHLVILPVEPHTFSLETLPKLHDLLKLAGDPPAFFVVTKAPVQGSEAQNAMDHIKAQGFATYPGVMHLRAAHRHAGNLGQTAAEYEPNGKAAEESRQLYMYTLQQADTERKAARAQRKPANARA